MGSESTAKTKSKARKSLCKAFAVVIFVATVFLCIVHDSKYANLRVRVEFKQVEDVTVESFSSKYSCGTPTKSFPERPKDQWRKPLWLYLPHHCMPDAIDRNVVNQLTGLHSAGKNFYLGRKGVLRQCVGITETVTCAIGDAPNLKASFYDKSYFMIVRNPMTQLPFAANKKGLMYHGLKGQMPVKQWRQTRDEWIEKMMDEWVKGFTDWMNSGYGVGFYIVYEDLMDIKKGPKILPQMAKVLNEAGFDTVEDKDMACAWYNGVGADHIKNYHENSGYEFGDYVPGFTKEQQSMMLAKLDALMVDVASNTPLITILRRYHMEIKDNFNFDEETFN